MIGFVTWPPFFTPNCYKGGQVTNQSCENMLYYCQGVKYFNKVHNFLASADIKVFACLQCCF